MAIKGVFTFLEWVQRLTKGYVKHTGKQPDGLAKLKIKMEAAQKVKQQGVVTQFPKDRITDPFTPRPGEKGGITSIKTGKKLDFASAKEFEEDLYSMGQNFIKNDPQFNLQLADDYAKGGTKTYVTQGEGKLHSPEQRQRILDKLKQVMKHDNYQTQFGEDLLDEDGVSILTDNLFRIDKVVKKEGIEGVKQQMDKIKGLSDELAKKQRETEMMFPGAEAPSPKRIKQGFSTQMKLNSNTENQALLKTFMKRENAEFNSLTREQKKEVFNMFDAHMKPKPDFASGGIAGELHLNDGGRVSFTKGGKVSSGLAHVLGV